MATKRRNTVLMISAVILILMIWGAAYLAQRPVSIPADQLKVESTSETGPSTAGNRETTGAAGSYIDYSESAIASTKDTKILFFYAPWCPQCRAIEADIKKLGVPAGVTIIKVDYDSNQALRQKYGVTIQTTLVRVDDDGNLVKKYVAYQEPTLASVKENLL